MKLPYGISNFKTIRQEKYLYVDKTKFIEPLENAGKYVFFIRPRRFGKSLFLSMLQHYYDAGASEEFQELFGDLYVGQHPTPLRNQYLILKLNFSALNTNTALEFEQSFKRRLAQGIQAFVQQYTNLLPDDLPRYNWQGDLPDVASMVISIVELVRRCNRKIYVIVDEYDHFANDVIAMGDAPLYKEMIRAAGVVRDFYEALKIGTSSTIDRIFITGLSPIMLDDMTSGFNIATNLTINLAMNDMLGFTDDDMRSIIQKIEATGREELLQTEMKRYYNGYCFHVDATRKVYNPDMVLYFFNEWRISGQYPSQMIDDNVKTDYGRLQRLIANERNRNQLDFILRNETVCTTIVSKFSFDRMYDEEYFVSLLFYMGLLTITGSKYGQMELGIPNLVIRQLFWEYFERRIKEQTGLHYDTTELSKAVWELAFDGKLTPLIDFLNQRVLSVLSYRDLIQFDEKHLKILLLSYVALSNIYTPISERETVSGYTDIYLEPDFRLTGKPYKWLWELKYLKASDRNKLDLVIQQGKEQLKRYTSNLGPDGDQDIKMAVLVLVGKEEIVPALIDQ
ncbi:AAA family ATPase [Paenibacillus sp. GCM10027626]|uniref:ATP-binding protein n=1 Tax=Paenibacillus sp. GCM10027626 TaxID=3273411 RepID=UPI003629234F